MSNYSLNHSISIHCCNASSTDILKTDQRWWSNYFWIQLVSSDTVGYVTRTHRFNELPPQIFVGVCLRENPFISMDLDTVQTNMAVYDFIDGKLSPVTFCERLQKACEFLELVEDRCMNSHKTAFFPNSYFFVIFRWALGNSKISVKPLRSRWSPSASPKQELSCTMTSPATTWMRR